MSHFCWDFYNVSNYGFKSNYERKVVEVSDIFEKSSMHIDGGSSMDCNISELSKKPQIWIYFGCKWICKLSIIVNEIIIFITRILARKKYGTSTIVVENIKFS